MSLFLIVFQLYLCYMNNQLKLNMKKRIRIKYLYQCCTADIPYSYKLFKTRKAMDRYLMDKVVLVKQRIIVNISDNKLNIKEL